VSAPLLRIDGLSHSFRGLTAVDGFSTAISTGEIVGLIGPNGAGKSTVFNLVCGLYQPAEGTMTFDGVVLNGRRPHRITSLGIGRTFQNIRLWNEMSVLDNIRIAQSARLGYGIPGALLRTATARRTEREVVDRARELLRAFGLDALRLDRPRNLPYGVQRRVEICRALAIRPRLLLLDEPAAGMNQGEIGDLIRLIAWVRDEFGVAVWIIEHQMRVIMGICERIQVLNFGETIAVGTPAEIRQDAAVVTAYLGEEVS
jgi:branched-chain amino acid transport system ATP-binding protein